MEVKKTVAPKRIGFFSSKFTKGDSYTIIEAVKDPKAKTTEGPENELESLINFLTSANLEAGREKQENEKDPHTATKLGKFILSHKETIIRFLEEEMSETLLRTAMKLEASSSTKSHKIVAAKQAKVTAARKKVKKLRKNRGRLFSLFPTDPELKDAISKFLDTLEFNLLGGDLEQLKEAPGALKLSATDALITPNQIQNIFIVLEGGVCETTSLPSSIQKEFDQAQLDYNLTDRTPDLPPKIVKTPPEESLSPFLPTPLVIFHTDLFLEFVLTLIIYELTAPRHPKNFEGFGTPPVNFTSDAYFMEQRLVGVNPCGIRKMTPETKALFQTAGVTIPKDEVNCYVWDYRVLDDFSSKNLPASVLLAYFNANEQVFKPLAVWAKPGKGNSVKPTVIKRDDGNVQWEFAKMCVRVSEWNVHELGSHLTLCHFVSEMVDVLTHHYLPKQHPVFQLLLPHFFRTIPLNDDARAILVPVVMANKLSSLSTEESFRFCSLMVEQWDFQENYVPVDLAKREVMGLPDSVYPFRKTALDTWNCIRKYVASALELLATMSDNGTGRTIMDTDALLRSWARAMRTQVTNFPKLELLDNEALYDALTLMIYTASHQHSAVNYFQAKYMSFLPASPGHMTNFPNDIKNLNDAGLMKLFPSYQTGMLQRAMVRMLSTHPEHEYTLVDFSRKPNAETKFSVEWQQLDNDLQVVQGQLKNMLAVYSPDSVSQKILAQSVLI